MKTLLSSGLLLTIFFYFTGCTLIRMGQESVEKVKTSTSYGYQNGIKPKRIRNLKDYIVAENDFIIIAESARKTLYKTRNESVLGKFSRLSDLVDYCEDIKGSVQFGKQFGASIASEYDSIDFEFSNIKSQYRLKRLRGYEGWMKCVNSDDDFEVKRKGRSKYFLITHAKEQLQGYSLRWYIDYFDLKNIDIDALNIGIWSYSSMVQLSGLCRHHKGQSSIINTYTNNTETSIDTYLLNRLDPLNASRGYLLASGSLLCKNTKEGRWDYVFDISYSKKYQKLLYTKRQ